MSGRPCRAIAGHAGDPRATCGWHRIAGRPVVGQGLRTGGWPVLSQATLIFTGMSEGLRLTTVSPDNVGDACRLAVRPEQESLVAPVAVSLAEAYAQPEIAWPRLVYDGDELVGS
jgi:hypothetical protein